MEQKKYTLPFSEKALESINAGDIILLSGYVYTARDAAHKRICEAITRGEASPFPLGNSAIYYCGPSPKKDGEIIGGCGPTTSARMDDYTPLLLEKGVKVMIGKGKRSGAVIEAMKKHRAVYFAAIGGAATLIKSRVKSASLVAYEDLGCEAVLRLYFEDLPLLCAVDCRGVSALK